MKPYWIIFRDGSSGCCEGRHFDDARQIAEHVTKKVVARIDFLPFAASPAIWQFDHPVHGTKTLCCHTPNACRGRYACPHVRRCDP